jgi:DNA-binding response OmpR family regulator
MRRTIKALAGSDESQQHCGVSPNELNPLQTFGKAHGAHYANASKTESIMKSGLVLLLTRDLELEQQSAMAVAASNARLIVARTVGVALEIIYQRGRELDLVVIDCDNGTRGMALLSALSASRADLPPVALTSTDPDRSTELALVDGAACCLSKPINAAELEMVIRVLGPSRLQADAAQPKRRFRPRISKLSRTGHTRGTILRRMNKQTSLRKEA